MFATVQGALAAPPTTGLVASADQPRDGARWQSGMAWVPERCGVGHQLIPWCPGEELGSYTPGRPEAVYYVPPTARWGWECSTLSGPLDGEQLRRMADAATPFVIARELWLGELAQDNTFTVGGDTWTNRWLASPDATVVGSGGAELHVALGALEQAAVEASRGQRIMLHLPVLLAGRLGDYVRRVGQQLLTRLDNWVVADAGYPGTGPEGQTVETTAWAYATSLVQVRWTDLTVVTDTRQTVTRPTNTITHWAERTIAATWDPCVHLATEITL